MLLSRFIIKNGYVPKTSKTGSYPIQYVPKKSISGTYSTNMYPQIRFWVHN